VTATLEFDAEPRAKHHFVQLIPPRQKVKTLGNPMRQNRRFSQPIVRQIAPPALTDDSKRDQGDDGKHMIGENGPQSFIYG